MYILKIEIYRKADRALETDYICKERVYIRSNIRKITNISNTHVLVCFRGF